MLAAWNRQDHLCPPFHGFRQGKICCCITGMKCHHHIYGRNSFIAGNISLIEMQFIIPIRSGKLAAVSDHIFFKIKAYDVHIKTLKLSEIIIHRKCKIGLSTAKIQDCNLPVFRKFGKNIPNKFQKTVDLPEFIISGSNYLSIFCHNSQIHQKRSCRSLFQNILFHTVMRCDFYTFILNSFMIFCFNRCLAFFAYEDASILAASDYLKLTEFFHCLLQIIDNLFP